MTDPLSLIPQENFVKHHVGKFSPKLNDEERCAILALVKSGVRRERVATAYGLDRRTVGHIANPQSPRYKEIRNKYKAMGHEGFVKEFLTEEVARKIAALPEDEKHPTPVTGAPSARANRLAGIHKVKPEQCEYEHRIEIKYCKAGDETEFEGWHFRDLDSKTNPEKWFHNGDESLRSSHACYDAAVENLLDD